MLIVRDSITSKAKDRMGDLADQYAAGSINIGSFVQQMRELTHQTALQQWLLSSGGKQQFTRTEAGKLGNYLRREYEKIQALATKMAAGEVTPGQARLYSSYRAGAQTAVFERAGALSRGGELPAYPGTDGQQCRSNCRCSWSWVDKGKQWHVIWELEAGAEHCPDCLANAQTYSASSPFVVGKPIEEMVAG
jgi:hypothetical protein